MTSSHHPLDEADRNAAEAVRTSAGGQLDRVPAKTIAKIVRNVIYNEGGSDGFPTAAMIRHMFYEMIRKEIGRIISEERRVEAIIRDEVLMMVFGSRHPNTTSQLMRDALKAAFNAEVAKIVKDSFKVTITDERSAKHEDGSDQEKD